MQGLNGLRRDVAKLLVRVSNNLRRAVPQCDAWQDLSRMQRKMLYTIFVRKQSEEPLYQKDLEQEFSIRGATATAMLKALEGQDYIVRVQDPADARRKTIALTARSLAIRAEFLVQMNAFSEILFADVSEEELLTGKALLDKMLRNIQRQVDDWKEDER